MTEELVGHLGYFGIALILVLGGFGLPIPEEAPVLLAAILSRNGKLSGVLAFSSCMIGVLLGDFLVYLLGYRFGERVLSHPWTRRLLTKPREAQIKGYFHRHGFKILIMGRFAVGFRTAAYLTAGILKLPPLKLLLTDLAAVFLSTSVVFVLGYLFAHQIEKGLHEAQQWVAIAIAVGVAAWLLHRHYKGQRRAGLPVGPPVLVGDDVPLPPDDLATIPEAPAVPSFPRADGPVEAPPGGLDAAADAPKPGEPTSPPIAAGPVPAPRTRAGGAPPDGSQAGSRPRESAPRQTTQVELTESMDPGNFRLRLQPTRSNDVGGTADCPTE